MSLLGSLTKERRLKPTVNQGGWWYDVYIAMPKGVSYCGACTGSSHYHRPGSCGNGLFQQKGPL